ncbi:MAG: hypothetical protein A2Y00_05500 [Omnitrophica WOR_2 bacterium GWF2_43_52]|nr:MAG: hypothetical protein A2Y01_07370 [Omnitrophica WOR_2 bacterium GWC2_44_8]OGX20555.1 MAG: hypothetical protein A2Y00_05500 [Omnitrophica WOR_2 bacterium GWF2_43_52]HAH21629.1 hypothetical protein [Candidatus Omnitrophota bacterium]HBG64222.1 hypothetical protein [Candidatus Omnitrophota bacterium]
METVRERIMANIKTTLEGVTVANGYNFDFTADTVQRWSMHGNRLADLPAVVISPGDEEEKGQPNPFEECYLNVYLDIFFVNDEGDSMVTDTYLNRLQGDMKKAILLDHTRGGEAIDTDVLGTTPFETTEGQPYAGIIMELGIRYRHLRSDPTAKN